MNLGPSSFESVARKEWREVVVEPAMANRHRWGQLQEQEEQQEQEQEQEEEGLCSIMQQSRAR